MRAILEPLDHDLAVIATLEPIGRPVFYATAPDAAADAVANRTGPDYVVVWPLDGGRRAGTAADPDEDAVLPYQFTCVARGPDGARWLVARIEERLPAVQVPGRGVLRMEPVDGSGGVRPDPNDDRLFIATPTWHLHTTPLSGPVAPRSFLYGGSY